MAKLFGDRLKRAEKRNERITELVDAEAELKAKLLEEQHAQEQDLRGIHEEFENLKRGGQNENLSSA